MAASLSAALKALGHDIGTRALSANLALPPDGRLTPALAVSALEAQGHAATLMRRRLADVPAAVLPVVLFLNGRDACVLLATDDTTAHVMWPARGDGALHVAAQELKEAYSGHLLLLRPAPGDDQHSTASQEAPGSWFWSAVRAHWRDYMQVVFASMLINLFALAIPIFTMNVYDRVFPNAALVTMWSLVAGVGLALVFDAILKWMRAGIVDDVGRRVDLSVSSRLFRHIADLKLSARAMASGSLMNALKDFEQIRDVFSSQTVATLTDLLFSFLFIAVIAYLGGPLAWPPALALSLVLVMGLALLVPLRRASQAARAAGTTKTAIATEAISEIETLKAIAGHGRMQARYEQQVAENTRMQEKSRRLATLATTITGLAQQAASIGIVVIGVYLALDGSITMGAVIAAMILSGRAMAPTAVLSGLFVRASFAVATLKSLNEIMGLPSDADTSKRHLNSRIASGALQLDSVGLTYPSAAIPALSDVSLRIAGQEKVGLIGPVGAGKTSLVRLMAGLYQPTEGLVCVDGLNITQLAPAELRAEIQLVPQEAVLFSGTLAENISFGHPGAADDDVIRAARVAGVDRIAAAHPDGFSMQIAERGHNLSGGQRQMVALARALLPRPRVLVLDEPTSSMDQQSERYFIKRLEVALKERPMTVVISTHRMGLLDLTDRVVLLNGGKIERDGPKAAVLASLSKGSAK